MNLFDFTEAEEKARPNLVEIANEAYDKGAPIMTDQEFDLLADTGLAIDPRNFRKKVNHTFPMGSLSKIKTAADLVRWLKGSSGHFGLMPKLDGNSLRLSYRDGQLVQAATRGDGHTGNDVTANVLQTRVVKTLPKPLTLEIRVEATIRKANVGKFEKNLRNVAAGLINAKDPQADLALIDCIAIDVVTERALSWSEKEILLLQIYPRELVVPLLTALPGRWNNPEDIWEFAQSMFEAWQGELGYKLDGVVMQVFDDLTTPLPFQADLIPTDKVALKFGSEEAETAIETILWSLGSHGKLTPVLQIQPVDLDGSTVARVSASNYALLKTGGMGVGARVRVTKSGDIIPYVTAVLEPSSEGLKLPECPECGIRAVLSETGVDALCPNPECGDLVRLQRTFQLFGIDFVSDATVETLYRAGHNSLEKIFSLSASDLVELDGFGQKTAEYITRSLKTLEISEAKTVKAAFLKGIGERKAVLLFNHYGSLENLIAKVKEEGLAEIAGFGPVQTDLLNRRIDAIDAQLQLFRKLGIKVLPHAAPATKIAVCCTGTCTQYPRKELKEVLEGMGYTMVDSVTQECRLLLCDDPGGNSTKLQKARISGIAIQAYNDFFAGL